MIFILAFTKVNAQPFNDSFANASSIQLGANNFDFGTFYSDTVSIANATNQAGEHLLNPAYGKTVWYRFAIPTHRKIRIRVMQHPETMPSNDVGFVVYQTIPGLPNAGNMATFTPLFSIGSYSENVCLEQGSYHIQVVGRNTANGNVFVEVTSSPPDAATYDLAATPISIGAITQQATASINWNCLSIETFDELCPSIPNHEDYTKSAWLTFSTDAHVDVLQFVLTGALSNYVVRLYQGNVATLGINGLNLLYGCTLQNVGVPLRFACELLQANSTYSLQLIARYQETGLSTLTFQELGEGSTQAPFPIEAGFSALNQFGQVDPSSWPAAGNTLTDHFACNGLLSNVVNQCGTVNPANETIHNGVSYAATAWFTFELTSPANLSFRIGLESSACNGFNHNVLFRLFEQTPDNNCTNFQFPGSLYHAGTANNQGIIQLPCVPPGRYSVQLAGTFDSNNPFLCTSHFGRRVSLRLQASSVGNNEFALGFSNDVDHINAGNALQNNVLHSANPASYACVKSVLPAEFTCNPNMDRAKYRQFVIGDANGDGVADSGTVEIRRIVYPNTLNNLNIKSVLFNGDANSLATAQNTFAYPQTFSGLQPMFTCPIYNQVIDTTNFLSYCLTPGNYTLVTLGDSLASGVSTRPTFRFIRRNTQFWNPLNPNNLGDVIAQNMSVSAVVDTFTCRANADVIAGLNPCNNSSKQIYREFFLSQDARFTVSEQFNQFSTFRIFQGRASDGLGSLISAPHNASNCNTFYSTPTCVTMPAGWYTVVSYAQGPDYNNTHNPYGPLNGLNRPTRITVSADTTIVPGPLFNRPFKACVANNDQPIMLINNGNADVTARGATYTLCTENFREPEDLPFSDHPINGCANTTRTSYYVFKIGQESNLRIHGTGNFRRQVYPIDVRTDSLLFPNTTPLVPCENTDNNLVFCRIQPGTYTLVLFATAAQNCNSVTPQLRIDTVGISRFDFAANAYDFGNVPGDNVFYGGKVGDVNPYNPNLLPSNDYFFCTTGASPSDPGSACIGTHFAGVYPDELNKVYQGAPGSVRRNLWYSFVIQGKGTVTVNLRNRTGNFDNSRNALPTMSLYRSNADGNLSIPELLAANQLDSTLASGLVKLDDNILNPFFCITEGTIGFSFIPDICSLDTIKRRYFVLVDLNESQTLPVVQVDLQVRFNALNIVSSSAPYDFFSTANHVGHNETAPPYNLAPLPPYTEVAGAWSDLSCATADAADSTFVTDTCTSEKKSVWYRVNLGQNGLFSFYIESSNNPNFNGYVALFRKNNSPDTTLNNGFDLINPQYVSNENGNQWFNFCLPQGEYYIYIATCNIQDISIVRPVIKLDNVPGNQQYDYYSDANYLGFNQTLPPYNEDYFPFYTTVAGAWGNLTCATSDAADENYNLGCLAQKKSIWYRFQTDEKGLFRFRLEKAGGGGLNNIQTQLFRQTIPGDSVLGNGLTFIPHAFMSNQNGANWWNYCLPPGEYFIFVSTCVIQDTSVLRPIAYLDDVPGAQQYDFYSTANVVGFGQNNLPYNHSPIPFNTNHFGAWGDLTCATSDASDENFNNGCLATKKSLWYKVNLGEQAILRFYVENNAGGSPATVNSLFKQVVDNDSIIGNGLQFIPVLSNVNVGGITWASYCLAPGEYYIHISTCNIGNINVVRPVVFVESSPGDDCVNAISTVANGPGVYNAETIIYCSTIGSGFGEDGSNMGCLLGPDGFYSAWFRFEYTGSETVDLLFQMNLSNFFNYGSTANVRYRLFYGTSCSTMVAGAECTSNAFINNSISCITSSVGTFYIQVVYPVGATGTLGMRYTLTENTNVDCNPFNPFLMVADFLYQPNCAGDSVFFSNFSTTGANLEYVWDFGFPGGESTEFEPQVAFPAGGGTFPVTLMVINPITGDTVSNQQTLNISETGNPVNIGNNQTVCTGDTIILGLNISGAIYNWSTGSSSSQIQVTQSGIYWLEVDIGGCFFADTVEISFADLFLDLGADTSYCPGESFTIQPSLTPQASFSWLDGWSTLSRTISVSGTYIIQAQLGNCSALDTIAITQTSLTFSLGNDTTACLANGLLIQPNIQETVSYLWHDGSSDTSFTALSPGMVGLTVTYQSCPFSDSLMVNELDLSFSLGNDTTICNGTFLLLNPDAYPLAEFLWNDGSTGGSVIADQAGTYDLTIQYEGCSFSDLIEIQTYDRPPVEIIFPAENPCPGDCFKLDPVLERAESFYWISPNGTQINNNSLLVCFEEYGWYHVSLIATNYCGSDTAQHSYHMQLDTTIVVYADTTIFAGDTAYVWVNGGSQYQWYTTDLPVFCDTCASTAGVFIRPTDIFIELTDQYGCPVKDTVHIDIYEDFGIYVPNAFSPNNADGLNDVFEIKSYGVRSLNVEIFARSGTLVFSSYNDGKNWDGRMNGRIVQSDVYVVRIEYESFEGARKKFIGKVLVL
ncbi:MAG: gliding motility-associated C-terminal domain-containing protein [Flavobacteriales bacterium]